MLVPSYLEFTIDKLTNDQHKLRNQMETTFGGTFIPGQAVRNTVFDQLEEQTRKNMLMFSQALTMFNPFAVATATPPAAAAAEHTNGADAASADDIDTVRRDMQDLQRRLDRLSTKD